MKLGLIAVCAAVLAAPVPAAFATDANPASIEGTVSKDPGGEPLKKAIIEMIGEGQDEPANYTATTEQDGRFKISGVRPGRYVVFVERTGFIAVDAHHHHQTEGIPISIEPGQQLKGIDLHMQPAAVLTGRVVDEDGDAM